MNMQLRVVIILGAVGSLTLAGCASRDGMEQLRSEIAAMRAQVDGLQEMYDLSTRELAKTVGELKALDRQLGQLAAAEQEAAQRVSQIETRLGETEQGLGRLRASVDSLSQALVRQATTARPGRTKPAPPQRRSPADPGERLYAAAAASFRAREHGQAVLEFTDFLSRYPDHRLAPKAQFLIAEAYYLQRDYWQAMVEYQKVVDIDPQGGEAADALLKIGLCRRALNDPRGAQDAWQQLVQMYPDSKAARQARRLIRGPNTPARRTR